MGSAVCSDLLRNILRRHGAEGEELLGQAQFAQLLQPILQDLADALAEKPVAVIPNIKVINGSKLKKLQEKLEQFCEGDDFMGTLLTAIFCLEGRRQDGQAQEERFIFMSILFIMHFFIY